MPKMELLVRPHDDKENVYIEMRMEGVPVGHVLLAAADPEKHLHNIARARAELNDPVPDSLDPNSIVAFVENPVCRVAKGHSLQGQGVPLVIRHPGMGWLSFVLSYEDAARIGENLIKASKQAQS